MEILFEDADLIVCIKPVGVLSERANAPQKGMPDLLEEICESEIFPVHRLDKAVGGVMVFAKNSKAAASLSKQIAEHGFVKEYLALVHGRIEEESAVLEDLIFKDSHKNKTYVVKRMRKSVKKARLYYEVISYASLSHGEVTAVKIRLYTGRSHQIRVQFASRKHPLVGDGKYGARDGESKISLWSYRLQFIHPTSKEKVEYSASVPCGMLMSQFVKKDGNDR